MNSSFGKEHFERLIRPGGPYDRFRAFVRERARPFVEQELAEVVKLGVSKILFVCLVIAPTFVAFIFYGFWASDRYVSQTLMTVRTADSQIATAVGGLLGSIGATPGVVDGHVVEEYIQSREIVRKLQEAVDLRTIYAASEADVWSRLSSDASFDDLFQYYLTRIDVYFDSTANVVHLDVQAYRPEDATRIAAAIVEISDEMVNRISQESRSDALQFAVDEVKLAENRLRDNRMSLYRFREEHSDLDPVRSAEAIGGIVASLEGELSRYKTELASLRSYMREDSAQIAGVKARIAAIEQQMQAERGRLTRNEDRPGMTYSDLLADYERLLIEEEFAKAAYTSTVSALELARADAGRKQAYLVAFVEPSLPDDPSKPERLLIIVSFLVCGLLAYGLLMLIGAAIREHARI
jgi:capsular polysaccharide transport system permease protein